MQFKRFLFCATVIASSTAVAQSGFGAAPKGDPTAVATRIIKYNFPSSCKTVTQAVRLKDGSIHAVCSGTEYRVGTMFNAKEGKIVEFSINCRKMKELLDVSC